MALGLFLNRSNAFAEFRFLFFEEFTFANAALKMSKNDYNQSLLAQSKKPQSAVDKIPIIARAAVSDRAKKTLNLVWLLNSVRLNHVFEC